MREYVNVLLSLSLSPDNFWYLMMTLFCVSYYLDGRNGVFQIWSCLHLSAIFLYMNYYYKVKHKISLPWSGSSVGWSIVLICQGCGFDRPSGCKKKQPMDT